MRYLLLFTFLLGVINASAEEDYSPEKLIIDDVQCEGNESTDCDIIEREIYLHPGDLINEDEIQSAKIRLQLLALFRNVDVRLKKSDQRGHVILIVEVEEDDPYFTEFNNDLHHGHKEFLSSFKLGNRNVFGRGKVLQGSISTAKKYDPNQYYSAGLEYIDPHLFGTKRNYFKSRFDFTFNECKDYSRSSVCQAERHLGSFDLGRRIFDYSFLQIGIVEQKSKQKYHDFDSDGERIEGAHRYGDFQGGGYRITYGWNSEDDPYFASYGSTFDLTYSFNKLFPKFSNISLNYKKNWSLSKRHILVGSMKSDWYVGMGTSNSEFRPGLQYVFQPVRFKSNRDINDFRFFFGHNSVVFNHSDTTNFTVFREFKTGVLFNSEALGIIQVNIFTRGF